ncbi:hypothetical protein [Ruegeria atlantica]|uniref:Uncharacterized protein n=1 Tax=Ruegeria atlantica TaxID=81569 RepID=A0A0P1E2C9_9RHOB|nr:hypothetical protein [Ruegeria atlantica]CUH41857.1 hypothetical protein RUM4293_00741 [Ruegeria atlantica]
MGVFIQPPNGDSVLTEPPLNQVGVGINRLDAAHIATGSEFNIFLLIAREMCRKSSENSLSRPLVDHTGEIRCSFSDALNIP